MGNVTRFDVDELNRVIAVTDPLGGVVRSSYDAVGNPLRQTDKRGTATEFQYDSLNRRTTTSKAGIALETLSCTPLGKVSSGRRSRPRRWQRWDDCRIEVDNSDINGDGRINALDLAALTRLCTVARCGR